MRLGDIPEGAAVRFPDGDRGVVVRSTARIVSVAIEKNRRRAPASGVVSFTTVAGRAVRFESNPGPTYTVRLPLDPEFEVEQV